MCVTKAGICKSVNFFANVFTIIAFLFGIYQFCEYKRNVKIERTLYYSNQIFSDTLSNAFSKVTATQFEKLEIKKYLSLSNESYTILVNKFYQDKAITNETDFFRLVDYFTSVYFCIERNLCTKEGLSISLQEFGEEFFESHYEYLCKHYSKKFNQKYKLTVIKTASLFNNHNICD